MDKRTFLAIVLTALVIIGLPMLFPSARRPPVPVTAVDSATGPAAAPSAPTPPSAAAPTTIGARIDTSAVTAAAPVEAIRAETTTVATAQVRYAFSTLGAVPVSVELPQHRDLRRGVSGNVQLRDIDGSLIGLRAVIAAGDTLDLRRVSFRREETPNGVAFISDQPAARIEYQLAASGFVTQVRGAIPGAGASSVLLVDLPSYLISAEADTVDDIRHLAYGYKPRNDDVVSQTFAKLDSTVIRTDTGTIDWVSARTKYFLTALLASPEGQPFRALRMQGGSQGTRGGPVASGTAVLPIPAGEFAFGLYAGPQTWTEMRAVGRDLENVNPVGGFMHAMVQPFATIVMRMLLWLKATLQLNYGWVLVIFGILVRLALWPLNQSAMRTSMKMQRLQPELQVIQKKYASDRAAQQTAIMKLYADHGMSPLSPLLGCLPMLLPMPVLFALYFVFQNTIEFRGVSFLWLPDLALKDPYYITPVFMGVSMFFLSWIGMRGAPPNPQAKMMTYMFPVVFTIMFLNFASGLNLYYAVQNVAALPQQWLIARERSKTNGGPQPAKKGGG